MLSFKCQALGFFKNRKLICSLFFSLCTALILCSYTSAADDKIVTFYSDDGKMLCSFRVELAVTPEEQMKGLMFRKSLKPDGGMLFVYNNDEIVHFWMKNTLIPLDMLFINSRYEVAGIHRSAKPLDETPVTSGLPVKYVLEINAGKADRCEIKVGSKVKFKNISR